jgi:competence protein ComEC
MEPLWPGDRVRFAASLHAAQGYLNPGSSDRARHLARLGVNAVAFVPADALLRLALPFTWPPGAKIAERWDFLELWGLRAVMRLRAHLLQGMRARLLGSTAEAAGGPAVEHYGLVAALVLGERGPLLRADAVRAGRGQPTIDAIFRAAGIFHILSVSGLHLAMAGWALYHGLTWLLLFIPWLAQRFVARRIAAVFALPAIVFYTLLTGAELPTVRAAVAAVLWLLAVACGRRARLPEAVSCGVLFMARPAAEQTLALALYEPSLVLSLAATLAIAYLRPLSWLAPRLHRSLRLPLRVLSASAAATLATLPLCAYYFAEAQPAGLLGNLVAVPIGEFLVLPGGLLGAAATAVAPSLPVGGLLLQLAAWASSAMLWVASKVAALGLSFEVPAPSVWQVTLWLAGLVACAGRRFLLGACFCIGALGLYLFGAVLPNGKLTVTFLDVGQGDAAVLETPHGGVIVVDAGPSAMTEGGQDLGELVVAPFLHRLGHRRIDLMVASHRHPDHIGGMASLLERFSVKTLWLPPGAALLPGASAGSAASANAQAWQRVSDAAARHGVAVEVPQTINLDGVSVEVLAPCAAFDTAPLPGRPDCVVTPRPRFSENDQSLVLRVRYGGRTILFPGDLELEGELSLLEHLDLLKAASTHVDILKAPHHCSRTSSSESFVKAMSPAWVICSVGHHNHFGFPHAEILQRYRDAGSVILRTDWNGAVYVDVSRDGALRVVPMHFPLAMDSMKK